MKLNLENFFLFLHHLAGVSIWTIKSNVNGRRFVELSIFALIMSVVNFCLVLLCRLFFGNKLEHKMSLTSIHQSKIFEVGEALYFVTSMSRYGIIYITVWIFFRQKKKLMDCIVTSENLFEKLSSNFPKNKDFLKKIKWEKFIVWFRLIALIIVCWNVPVLMVVQSLRECFFYRESMKDYRVIIVTILFLSGNFNALIDIFSNLLFVESKFKWIQYWLNKLSERFDYKAEEEKNKVENA